MTFDEAEHFRSVPKPYSTWALIPGALFVFGLALLQVTSQQPFQTLALAVSVLVIIDGLVLAVILGTTLVRSVAARQHNTAVRRRLDQIPLVDVAGPIAAEYVDSLRSTATNSSERALADAVEAGYRRESAMYQRKAHL